MANTNLREIIKEEYKKSKLDPIHFMKQYCFIQHPIRGKIKFELYPFQEKTLQELFDNRLNIILKSRQLGISTLSAGYALWLAMFHSDKNILVVATKASVAKNLITKVREMYANLPGWMKTTVQADENNKMSLRFVNGSQIKAVAMSPDAGRSEALSLLIIDEAAFIRDIDELWTSVQSTITTGGSAIVLSTPNGIGNWFHKMWVGAEEGLNGFNPIKLHWTVHPERDQKWRDAQDAELGSKAAQECDCDFLSSGDTVIPPDILTKYKELYVTEPKEKRGLDRCLWIWDYPDYSKSYIISADCSRGDSSDYSAFHVIDIETMTQVAEYKGLMQTRDYGNLLVNTAVEYNNALLVIENANVGWAVIQIVLDREYPNLYYSGRDMKVVDPGAFLNRRNLYDKSNLIPGFTTSGTTRGLMISKLDMLFREQEIVVRSKRLIEELFVFIWRNGHPEAQKGYNDDLVMAFAIGAYVRDTALRMKSQGLYMSKQTLGSISKSAIPVYSGINRGYNPWKQNTGKGDLDLREFL